MVILGNLISASAYALDFIFGYLYNKKSIILLENIVSSIMTILASLCLGAVSGAIIAGITILRLIVIYQKDKKQKQWIPLYVVFLAVYMSVTVREFTWITVFLILSSLCSFTVKWFAPKMQTIRISAIIANLLAIPYSFAYKNYTAAGINILNTIGITISYIKWKKTESLVKAKEELSVTACSKEGMKEYIGFTVPVNIITDNFCILNWSLGDNAGRQADVTNMRRRRNIRCISCF